MSEVVISVENLSKSYRLGAIGGGTLRADFSRWLAKMRGKEDPNSKIGGVRNQKSEVRSQTSDLRSPTSDLFWALRDVSFEVKQGEILGIIGRNGAGKSTLLKILSRVTAPSSGQVKIKGRIASLLEVGTGFHPELTGRENIFLNGAILGMSKSEIKNKLDEIVDFSGVEQHIDTPVKRYSSGMYVRLAFAVAAHLEPKILIIDEVLAVGDAAFQKKCIGKIQSISEREGRTVLFVSHNLQAVRQICRRSVVLNQGQILFTGDVAIGINRYVGIQGDHPTSAFNLSNHPRTKETNGVRLQRVEFFDHHSNPASEISYASDLFVVIHFCVERFVRQLDIPMALAHVEGQNIFSESYSDSFSKLDLAPGNYRIQFTIPTRFLKLESYYLIVGAYEDGQHCDLVEGLPLPKIINASADPHLESYRLGVVRIPVTWTPATKV